MRTSGMAIMSLPLTFVSLVFDIVRRIKCSEGERNGGRDDANGRLFADVGGELASIGCSVVSRKKGKPTYTFFARLRVIFIIASRLRHSSQSLRDHIHTL